MKISQATLDAISASELAAQNAGQAGVKAVIALLEDYDVRPAKHGDAKVLSDLLKNAGVKSAACKRYAELTVMASATVHHRAVVARSKVKAVAKAETEKSSVLADMAKLSSMESMAKVRQWSKDNGPKVKEKAPTEAPTEAPTAPTAPNIEAIGQIREVKETIAMINAGQITAGEALATIAGIVGIQLTSVPKAPAGKAKAKDKALPQAV